MSSYAFGSLTAVFNAGGLLGSLFAGSVIDTRGKKVTLCWISVLLGAGALVMGLGWSLWIEVVGRFASIAMTLDIALNGETGF